MEFLIGQHNQEVKYIRYQIFRVSEIEKYHLHVENIQKLNNSLIYCILFVHLYMEKAYVSCSTLTLRSYIDNVLLKLASEDQGQRMFKTM